MHQPMRKFYEWLNSNAFGWLALAGAALALAAVFLHFLTPWGPWAFSDSADYIEAARNLARGWGLTTRVSGGAFRLLTEHAPGYPVMLSFGFHLTHDWIAVARWEDILAVALFALLLGRLFWQITARPLVGVLALEIVATTFAFTRAFTSAMSEPWFLVWGTAALVLLESDLRAPKGWRTVLVGLFAVFAALTRYAGLHLAAVIFFTYGLLAVEAKSRRWVRGALTAALPTAAVLGWMAYARLAGGGFAGKFTHTPASILHAAAEYARQFAALINAGYSVPPARWQTTVLIWIAVLGAALVSFDGAWRLRSHRRYGRLARGIILLTLEAALYLLVIGAFFALGNPKPTVDLRMFTPAYFAAIGAVLLWLVLYLEGAASRLRRSLSLPQVVYLLAAVGLAVWAYATPFQGKMWGETIHRYGKGYTQRAWHEWAHSDMYRYLRGLPPDLLLITNDWGGLRLWCDHATAALPRSGSSKIAPLGKGNTARDRLFAQNKAALVILKLSMSNLKRFGKPESVVAALTKGLTACYRSPWGGVYFAHPPRDIPCKGG